MGQQINPIGIRVGLHRKWKSNWFLEDKYYTNFLLLNFEINKYLTGILRNSTVNSFLINCYISKISLEKLYICVFFYRLRDQASNKRKQKKRRNKGGKIDYAKFESKININLKKIFIKKNKIKGKSMIILNIISLKKINVLYSKSKILLKKNNTELNLIKIKKIKFNNKRSIILQKINNNDDVKSVFLKKIKKMIKLNRRNLKLNSNKNFKLIKKSLSELTNSKIYLIMINSLSFLKFYEYLYEHTYLYRYSRKVKYGRLNSIRKMVAFYRYDVKLITDAMNIIYITLLLKQPLFLAQFIGYQLKKTPRNFYFNKIIKFLTYNIISTVRNRKEILGCRVEFKGRLGGRRTRRSRKSQFINEGIMPLNSYNSRIEFGDSKGLTRFGVIGIKIWLCYDTKFNSNLQKDLLLYFGYSKKKYKN